MGALPQPRPSERTGKLPGRAANAEQFADNYGRDPRLPSERLRKRTNWKSKRPAHAPLFFGALSDLHRITNPTSRAEVLLLLHGIAESYGRFVEPGEAYQESTEAMDLSELGQRCGTDVRTMQRLMNDLDQAGPGNPRGRGVMRVQRAGQGKVILTPLVKDWQKLPDYAEWLKMNTPKAEPESDDEPEADDPSRADVVKGTVRLCKRPQRIKPGASKSLKVTCGVTEFMFTNPLVVDLEIDPVVQGGRLVCVPTVAEDQKRKLSEDLIVSNNLTSEKRHGCRVDTQTVPPNGGRNSSEVAARSHEVASLFDPLLQKSGARLLSGDASALRLAVEAIGPHPIDALANFLHTGRSPRAKRPFSSPMAVVAFIREFVTNQKGAAGPDISERAGLLQLLGFPVWETIIAVQGKYAVQTLRTQLRRSVDDPDMTVEHQNSARRLLEILA